MDKYKLSEQEKERRRQARVSKNRVLGADTASKRSYIEAWAKDIASGVSAGGCTDQDRPGSSRDRGIDYSLALQMLRPNAGSADDAGAEGSRTSAAPMPMPTASTHAAHVQHESAADAAQSSSSAASSPNASRRGGLRDSTSYLAAVRPDSAPLLLSQQQQQHAVARGGSEVHKAAGSAVTHGADLHKGAISITPAGGMRARFDQAAATTIISDHGSDDEGSSDGLDARGKLLDNESTALDVGVDSRDAAATAAFEHWMYSMGPSSGGGAARDDGPGLGMAARLGGLHAQANAGQDRLDAIGSRMQQLAGLTSAPDPRLQEEVSVLRSDLRQVQKDNAALRQELSLFSTHTSTLLTQLQAQVQQLLRLSSAGGASSSVLSPLGQPSTHAHSAPLVHIAARGGIAGPAPQHAVAAAPPPVSRNIFADIDVSALQVPTAPTAGIIGRSYMPTGTPALAVPSVAYRDTPTAAGSHAMAAPPAPHPVPVTNLDDTEISLPSYAAFRRSTVKPAFTAAAARPAPAAFTPTVKVPVAASSADDALLSAPIGGALHGRSFPKAYQPRSLGDAGVPAPGLTISAASAAAAAAPSHGSGAGAYMAETGMAAAFSQLGGQRMGAGSQAAWQPLVFNMVGDTRPVRAHVLSADNSMSLSAHTASRAAGKALGK